MALQEDQLGVGDKNTARTFYAAGVFYDVLQQFKDIEPEIEVREGGPCYAMPWQPA
jgi:hypothetical protein